MRRIVATGVAAAILLGHSGCGGGIEEGMPADTTPAKSITIDPGDTLKMKKAGESAPAPAKP
jgi:hypothetical protein